LHALTCPTSLCHCSGLAELEWTNDFRTVTPKTRANTLAVVARGFSSGKGTWSFRLDKDSPNDEASCFVSTRLQCTHVHDHPVPPSTALHSIDSAGRHHQAHHVPVVQ